MLFGALISLWIIHCHCATAESDCVDLHGRIIYHGLHYVPGPDTCTLCVCNNGLPKVCKAVLCSPPQDCQSFRMGNICCEFICLDDVVKPVGKNEAQIRLAAGGAAAIFLISLFVIVYQVRKQKRRPALHADDQRSLTSIGYISGSMGYMGGTCETALGAWKPSGNYLPRGEAPPPYDEVIAQCRNDQIRLSGDGSYHRSYASSVEPPQRAEDMQCVNHGYINVQRPVAQIANTQNCYNAPLLQPAHQQDARESTIITHHPLAINGHADERVAVAFPHAVRLTGSLGAISARAFSVAPEHERPHNVPGFYTAPPPPPHLALHRTIPRISTDSGLELGFSRADRSLAGEVRRSFHRPERVERAERNERFERAAGRSVPRNLDIASAAPTPAPDSGPMRVGSGRSRAHSAEESGDLKPIKLQQIQQSQQPPPSQLPPPQLPPPQLPPTQLPPPPQPSQPEPAHNTLPLTVDKPSCVCSYDGSAGPGAEDTDDYRSECENCKSTDNPGWEEGGEWTQGTQTLQRRAPPTPAPPPATATLPQPVTRRTAMGPPSNWENWFNTIPDSDTESEED